MLVGGKRERRLLFEVLEARQMFNGTADLRVVAYNIAADIYSEGITACATTGRSRPCWRESATRALTATPDRSTSWHWKKPPATRLTVAPIVTALNNHYGAGTYVASTYQATTSGGGDGDGPNALVYNSTTVTLVSTEGVGNPSDAGLSAAAGAVRISSGGR